MNKEILTKKYFYHGAFKGKITLPTKTESEIDIFNGVVKRVQPNSESYVKAYAVQITTSAITRVTVDIGVYHEETADSVPSGTFDSPKIFDGIGVATGGKSGVGNNAKIRFYNDSAGDSDVYYYFEVYSTEQINCENSIGPQLGYKPVTDVSTNTAPFLVSSAGGYIRQDSTATIAKESGGNLATIAGDTTSIDGKITACNTGAVVVASGAITETNSGTIASNTGAVRNLRSATYYTEASIKITLNQAEQRIDNVASLFTTKISEIATAGFKVTGVKVTPTAGSWASQSAYLDIRRNYTTIKRVTGLHMVTGFVDLAGTEPNNTVATNELYVCSFDSTEEVIITIGFDYNIA